MNSQNFTLLVATCVAICSSMALDAFAQVTSSKKKQSTVAANKQMPKERTSNNQNSRQQPAKKVQILVLANPGANSSEVSDVLRQVHGTVVDTTSDGQNTFHLVEIDEATYNDAVKTLKQDKNIKSVSLNHGYTAQYR